MDFLLSRLIPDWFACIVRIYAIALVGSGYLNLSGSRVLNKYGLLIVGMIMGLVIATSGWYLLKGDYTFQGSLIDPPVPAADIELTDQYGTPFRLSDQQGKNDYGRQCREKSSSSFFRIVWEVKRLLQDRDPWQAISRSLGHDPTI